VDATAEEQRLDEDRRRARDWKRFGPYLSERQWGTVREDYSATGDAWGYLPHDQARSRVYRWGEDGLLGLCDRQGRLCYALALWNGVDPILKERLFGLTGPEGNHGEDVKELYYYLDATPTHSYARALYKYPQRAFPYLRLVEENRRRGRDQREFELADAGMFAEGRYFDVFTEHAKAAPNDLCLAVTVANRGPDAAPLVVLPTVWFRNTWTWGREGEDYLPPERRPWLAAASGTEVDLAHPSLGRFRLTLEPAGPLDPELVFTENETNFERLFGAPNRAAFCKDAFHLYVVGGDANVVNPARYGTKMAGVYRLNVPAGGQVRLRLRLTEVTAENDAALRAPFGDFESVMIARRAEADAFYAAKTAPLPPEQRNVVRQAYAGLLWTRQLYEYDVTAWLEGDPAQPPPPPGRRAGRNADWLHLYNRDVISMPDKWEYPWYASWDLAFHMLPFARIDPAFAKEQLLLFTREWYMHPNGQLPAYEFALSDVNPPVHAWAAWRVYKIAAPAGQRDRAFLARVFQKLLLNFTWWVNRKDAAGRNLFTGGFLGLDNIGVFDRSHPLSNGQFLEQADGTAWIAFFCLTMLSIALELAQTDPVYEDMASKFFEHFVRIADAINNFGGTGLWDEQDGFFYDRLHLDGTETPLSARSMVGLLPLIAVEVLDYAAIDRLPDFKKRLRWFLDNRRDLASVVSFIGERGKMLLAIPSRQRLVRVLRRMLDEREFLSPYGIRSMSKAHQDQPFRFSIGGQTLQVGYEPGESQTALFGGNSNWRGPIWMPPNYLLIEALERYHHFYGDDLRVEHPVGSGRQLTLLEVARDLSARVARLFLPDAAGRRPCHGDDTTYATDPACRDLLLFYEYFHGDTGRGMGASHQTGWTALVLRLMESLGGAGPP
jgi:Glycosyl hydrolase family 63 C-terminal domain